MEAPARQEDATPCRKTNKEKASTSSRKQKPRSAPAVANKPATTLHAFFRATNQVPAIPDSRQDEATRVFLSDATCEAWPSIASVQQPRPDTCHPMAPC